MLIHDKKHFYLGLLMSVVFFVILGFMFVPLFDGHNAMEASDNLFNSISKASTNHFPAVSASVENIENNDAQQTLAIPQAIGENLVAMLQKIGAQSSYAEGNLEVSGDLKSILNEIIADSKTMFANDGQAIETKYDIAPKEAVYAWWVYLNTSSKALMLSKRFAAAKIVDEVKTKAVEVGYNYYGIDPTPVTERLGIMIFSLVFYVVYTLWWGFSIFYLCEGIGLVMKKTAKQES